MNVGLVKPEPADDDEGVAETRDHAHRPDGATQHGKFQKVLHGWDAVAGGQTRPYVRHVATRVKRLEMSARNKQKTSYLVNLSIHLRPEQLFS